ncbi:hypothetical protein DFR76_109197 [Nocardia pseudobrasiliensis]|uniref:Uncharacterized protein n=1 Tax=Nocardia pseudobrasiliensis TaxID=45979 RepID=A0A370HZC8_9NOCA|nr:hypothetical protein DFR76_109197 [Nocardia pseudobrasiliensis]
MVANGIGMRIAHLRALIEQPATGGAERATALRMLDRLLREEQRGRPGADRRYGRHYDRVARHAGLAEIADRIRADIAFAQTFSAPGLPPELEMSNPVRDAPSGISYSVDVPFDGRIVITIMDVPPGWGWVLDEGCRTVSPALRTLAGELAEILAAYNHDGADVGARFFGGVRTEDATLVW